jgi:signal transduction histidine kinase
VPLLLALVITGAMVLRMQLRPLVAELLKSREALRERTVELERTNADLERASHAKDRFLATMSHELRTPLNAILGFTGTLLMRLPGALTNTQEEQLRTVQAAGKHLLSLINDLLDLASIESGEVVMKRETVECEEVLNELANALRPLAERKGLRLDCRLGTPIAPLCTDRRALLQILMNLTNNAIKYTSSAPLRSNAISERTEARSPRISPSSIPALASSRKNRNNCSMPSRASAIPGRTKRAPGSVFIIRASSPSCSVPG